jgi:N-acetylglucosamine kinase-like BadF-type ATPase
MTDVALDSILNALREVTAELAELANMLSHEQGLSIDYCQFGSRINRITANLDAMIKQRNGRPDDEPAKRG